MDTFAMIKKATENSGKIYESNCGRVHYVKGVLRWVDSTLMFPINSQTLKLKWSDKGLQSVDVITALKAYDNGKTVICKLHYNEYIYQLKSCMYMGLVDQKQLAITSLEILEGEWFIKD